MMAGTGKSTIAQTFSATVAETDTLSASAFCSRDYLARKELKKILPTLSARASVLRVSKLDRRVTKGDQLGDPSVVWNSLISQLKDLIADPLSTKISCFIVVDGLDECVI